MTISLWHQCNRESRYLKGVLFISNRKMFLYCYVLNVTGMMCSFLIRITYNFTLYVSSKLSGFFLPTTFFTEIIPCSLFPWEILITFHFSFALTPALFLPLICTPFLCPGVVIIRQNKKLVNKYSYYFYKTCSISDLLKSCALWKYWS